jgi:hypothetical protein
LNCFPCALNDFRADLLRRFAVMVFLTGEDRFLYAYVTVCGMLGGEAVQQAAMPHLSVAVTEAGLLCQDFGVSLSRLISRRNMLG